MMFKALYNVNMDWNRVTYFKADYITPEGQQAVVTAQYKDMPEWIRGQEVLGFSTMNPNFIRIYLYRNVRRPV